MSTASQVQQPRRAERLVTGQPTSDGAGVKLTRVLTHDLQQRLDPFLMLDNFASDNSHHPFFDDFELTMDESRAVFDLLRQWGIPKKNIMDGDMDAVMDKKIVGPENIYRFFQELETIFHDAGGDYDNATPQNVIGFTGDFDAMRRIDPRQLAILQLAVKKDAKVSHEPIELELRINPEDVAVVRYLQPA